MKYLILVGDGMADFPLSDHDGRTPLEMASTPAMDEVTRLGLSGLFDPIPEGLAPGSDIGNLSLFGYDPKNSYTGRAPFEAANQGIVLQSDQVAFRCNLVTLRDGLMEDFTSGHISSEEAATIITSLNRELAQYPVFFSAGVGYRHITIVSPGAASPDDLVKLQCTPPHDITGRPYADFLPDGPGADFVRELMEASRPILERHPTNAARVQAGKPPTTSIWLWGQGRPPAMESYEAKFGLTGSVISAVDLVKGIGCCAGLEVINVPGATGYLDTNYAGKVEAALNALKERDFVYLHVEAPDEASHEGRLDKKIRAIEDFDSLVVAPCLEHVQNRPGIRLMVAPDHVTALSTKTHAGGPVPFAIFGEGIARGTAQAYHERAARETGVRVSDGYQLTTRWIRSSSITASILTAAS